MARLTTVHLLALFFLFCTVHYTRLCAACEKHKHLTDDVGSSDDCPDEKTDGADNATKNVSAPSSLRGSSADESELIDSAEGSPLKKSRAEEGKLSTILRSPNIEEQILDVVQRAVKHLEAQDLLQPLQDVEYHARFVLGETAARLSDAEDEATEEKLTALMTEVVRLLSAARAVRSNIINVSMAWVQLRESIHNLAETEKSADPTPEKAAMALSEFLESRLWMSTTTESVQTSAKHLRQILQEKNLSKAFTADETGEKISKKILTLLQRF